MMTLYETDKHLAKFLPIIRDSPVYPIIYSSTREVLSMPPIVSLDCTIPRLTQLMTGNVDQLGSHQNIARNH